MIKGAPVAAFILFALGVLIAYPAFNWRYAGQIESLQSQNNLLRDQVQDYKERLGLVPPDTTAYSKLTNFELKQTVDRLVAELRVFASRADRLPILPEQNQRVAEDIANARTQAEKDKIWNEAAQKEDFVMQKFAQARAQYYQQQYKTRVIALRDEMLRRLPKQSVDRNPLYDQLSGATPIADMADDLERLALMLPQRESR